MHSVSPRPERPPSASVRLRRVDPAQLRLSRQLGAGAVWPLDDPDLPWKRLELTLVPSSAWSSLVSSPLRLQGRHGAVSFSDATLLTLLTGVQYPGDATAALMLELHRMAVAALPPALLEGLGGPFHVLAADQASSHLEIDEAASLECLLTLTEINGDCHTFLLQASLDTVLRWSGQPGWQPHPLDHHSSAWRNGPVGRLRFSGGIHLGRRALSLKRLRSLRAGDAVLIPSKDGDSAGTNLVLLGSELVRFSQPEDDSYVFEGWVVEPAPLSNPSHVKAIEKVPLAMDTLKVDLDFIVGRLSMTVAELSALGPGRILPLEVATPPRVRIVAHGTELGSGELIDVDGRLAVEITEWGSRP